MDSIQTQTYSIGEVVAQLRPEYEISESNLRFWEKQGLLAPQRTPGGHRLYTAADVSRIKLIKRLQENRYLPLAAIKHFCAAQGETVDDAASFFEAVYRPRHFESGFVPLTAEELSAQTGLSVEVITLLTEAGALTPTTDNDEGPLPGPLYDEDDRQICRLIAELLPLGIPVEAFTRKARLLREHAQAEWEQVVLPILPQLMAVPAQAKLRLKSVMDEMEPLLFDQARRQVRKQMLTGGELPPFPCQPDKEER